MEWETRIRREGLVPRHDLEPAPLLDLMARLGVPGVSVALIEDGEIAWACGYGVRERGGAPVTPDTIFQAGSVSKPVTAVAVMRLVQEGRLDLDRDVNDYLHTWTVPPNGDWQPRITLRQLLCHGTGMTVHGFPGYNRNHPVPTVPQILDGLPPANTPSVRVSGIPGAQFRYSGGGTTIVQQVLIDVLGMPFPQIMRELVLDPLGMVHSTYEQPLPERWWDQAGTGHRTAGVPVEGRWHVYPEMAAAGLWTTPADLCRLAIDLQRTWAGEPGLLLPGTVREMLSPQVEKQIGIGFFLDGEGRATRFGHSGSDEGFVCELAVYREGGKGAAVMTNSDWGDTVFRGVLLTLAREYGWPEYPPADRKHGEPDPAEAAACAGEYLLASGLRLTVTASGNGLSLEPAGQPAFPLYRSGDLTYLADTVHAELRFERGDDGTIAGLQLDQGDGPRAAQRSST
jgi:CubicO group peptidase (beta-lactamase class C family)